MIKKLENAIKFYNFSEAKFLVKDKTEEELEGYLLELAFENQSILYYTFVNDLIKNEENATYHYLASILLSQPLCHIDGAYQAAYFHAKRAVELDGGNIGYKEYLLFFNSIPDRLLTDEEAKSLAHTILETSPINETAVSLLKDLNQ